MNKRADQIKPGDKLIRFGHVLPVLAVCSVKHHIGGDVIAIRHATATIHVAPNALVKVAQ